MVGVRRGGSGHCSASVFLLPVAFFSLTSHTRVQIPKIPPLKFSCGVDKVDEMDQCVFVRVFLCVFARGIADPV